MPEDRYQKPREVAAALLVVGRCGSPVQYQDEKTMAEGVVAQRRAAPVAGVETDDTVAGRVASQKQRRDGEQRHWRRLTVAGGGLLVGVVALFVGLLWWQRFPHEQGRPNTAGRSPVVERPTDTSKEVDEAWLKQVVAMSAKEQVDAVAAKLKELNPDFDGKVDRKIENGVVTKLQFVTDKVTDLSPVRSLTGLKSLTCNGSELKKGKLFDLTPLKGMKLARLECNGTQVSDLSPLKGMPLTALVFHDTKIADLSPLKDMKLTYMGCGYTQVSDLSPLKDMKLVRLDCCYSKVADLTSLTGMQLQDIRFTPKNITKGIEVLHEMKSLKTIGIGWANEEKWPAAEFWKKLEAKELK